MMYNESASTIHAHWYKDKNTKLCKCSNCRKYAAYTFPNAKVWEQYKSPYCPTCGARMDEDLFAEEEKAMTDHDVEMSYKND